MKKIKIALLIMLLLPVLGIVSCGDDPDGCEPIYIKLDITGAEYKDKGKHGYFVEFGKDGGNFTLTSADSNNSCEFYKIVHDGSTVYRDMIEYAEGTPFEQYSWSWGTIRQTSAPDEPYAYEIRIVPSDGPSRRSAAIEVGQYPWINYITIVQEVK